MKVEEMEFSFQYKKRKINAKCLKFKPRKKIQYRVSLGNSIKDEEVYIFYQDKNEERLWWHELPFPKEEKAEAIATALERIIFLPN